MGLMVYLDDERTAPSGWTQVRWPHEAIELMKTAKVDAVSLDHHLGDDARGTGYDVLLWVEEQVALHDFMPPLLYVHSANTGARQRMQAAIVSIECLLAARNR